MTDPLQMQVFGVVGSPVKHSLSPKIHQFWYEQNEIAARYVPLDMTDETPVEDLVALARSGFSGLNITLPYKTEALRASAKIDDAAFKIGAANTLTLINDDNNNRVWAATNTDHSGFLWSLERWIGKLPSQAVIIGAGGAARAVAYALSGQALKLDILNRTVSRADDLAKDLELTQATCHSIDDLDSVASSANLVINTISLGHSGGELALPGTKSGHFMDISYGKAAEPTLKVANENGWNTLDGLPMLVGQAADAFKIWFGLEPDRDAVLAACRKWTGT
ncbi:MAG: shikimate dehydrogenase [Ponticaulis sp.]|nr:shikimate dehydrogenase [Ponticaulis sp.]|tara:strand:+ start:50892 stop:51728 length:837 start_codon:yes stop_codon:yes gene_type:complete